MKVSLIMPTINRHDELIIFLESLEKQTYKNFELIIVDQNLDGYIFDIIEDFQEKIDLKYIRSEELGLSFNRNKGLLVADGEIIGFPDDDCEYQDETLEKVVNFFLENEEYKIFSCRTLEKGKDYGTGIMAVEETDLKYKNVEETVKSITFFVNFQLEDLTLFDPNLGVGSHFGSGEETDYVLNLLHKGFNGKYFPNEIIYHPAKKGNYEEVERAYSYALGYGAIVKKEVSLRKNHSYLWKYMKKLFRTIGGMIISKERRYYFYVFLGRIHGYSRYTTKDKKRRKNETNS